MEQKNAPREESSRDDQKDTTRKPYQRPNLTEYGSIVALTQGVGGTVPDPSPSTSSRGV
jgi:hypothetical protein